MVAVGVPSGRVSGLPFGQPVSSPMPIDNIEATVADLLTPTLPNDTTRYMPGRTMRYRADMERLVTNLGVVITGIWSNQFSENLKEICDIYFTDEQRFFVKEIVYGGSFPTPTPVHGTSRAITHNETSSSFSQTRLGQSFRINYDTMHLPEFVQEFMINLMVLAGNTVKVAEFGLLESLLMVERRKLDRDSMKRMGMNAYISMINARNHRMGLGHKSSRGLIQHLQFVKMQAEHELGRPFTHVIWPKDKNLILASTSQYADFDKAGPLGPETHFGFRTIMNVAGMKFMEPPSLPGSQYGHTTMASRHISGAYLHYYRFPDQDVKQKWVNMFDITTNNFESTTEDDAYSHIAFILDVDTGDRNAVIQAYYAFMVAMLTNVNVNPNNPGGRVEYDREMAEFHRRGGGGGLGNADIRGIGKRDMLHVNDDSVIDTELEADILGGIGQGGVRGAGGMVVDDNVLVFTGTAIDGPTPGALPDFPAHPVPSNAMEVNGQELKAWATTGDKAFIVFNTLVRATEKMDGASLNVNFGTFRTFCSRFRDLGNGDVKNQIVGRVLIAEAMYDAWRHVNASANRGRKFERNGSMSPIQIMETLADSLKNRPNNAIQHGEILQRVLFDIGAIDVWYSRWFLTEVLGFTIDGGFLAHSALGDIRADQTTVTTVTNFNEGNVTKHVYYSHARISRTRNGENVPVPAAIPTSADFNVRLEQFLNGLPAPYSDIVRRMYRTYGDLAFRLIAKLGPGTGHDDDRLIDFSKNWVNAHPTKEKLFLLDVKAMMAGLKLVGMKNEDNPYFGRDGMIDPEIMLNTSDNYFNNDGGILFFRPVDTQYYTRFLMLSPAPGAIFMAMSEPIFTEGMDAATQTGLLASSFYYGAHIPVVKAVVAVNGTMYSTFVGGYNATKHTFKTARDFAIKKRFRITNAKEPSVWVIPAKKGTVAKQPFIHTTGTAELLNFTPESPNDEKPEYPCAQFWSKVYGFDKAVGDIDGLTDRANDVISKQLFPCTYQYMTPTGLRTVYGNTCHGMFSEAPGARVVREGGTLQYKKRID